LDTGDKAELMGDEAGGRRDGDRGDFGDFGDNGDRGDRNITGTPRTIDGEVISTNEEDGTIPDGAGTPEPTSCDIVSLSSFLVVRRQVHL